VELFASTTAVPLPATAALLLGALGFLPLRATTRQRGRT
jgi:hypothetical protein